MKKLIYLGLISLSTTVLVACSSTSSNAISKKKDDKIEKSSKPAEIKKKEGEIPTEYKTALIKAGQYLDTVGMSKAGLEKQLVEFEKFSPEAVRGQLVNFEKFTQAEADYAVANLDK